MIFKTKYLGFLGIIIVIYIFSLVNWKSTLEILKNINIMWLILSFFLSLIIIIIGSLKWRYVVNRVGINLTVKDSLIINFKSLFAEYSPGKLGFLFVTAIYLKEKIKEGWSKVIFSTLFNKFMEIWIMSIEALIAVIILIFLFSIKSSIIIPIIIALFLIITSFTLFKNQRIMKSILMLFFKRFAPKKNQDNFNENFVKFYDCFKNINLRAFLILLFYQIIILIVAGLSFYFLAISLGINLPFYLAIILEPIIAIASILPISFSGLGTREASVAFIFSLIDISLESALIFSLIIFMYKNILILLGLILVPLEKIIKKSTIN